MSISPDGDKPRRTPRASTTPGVFAANLIRLKDKSGLTWIEIGQAIGHRNDRYVLALAQGRFEPRVLTVNRLAEVFGVTPAEMLEER